MTGPYGFHVSLQPHAQKEEISQEVQGLVAGKLIGKAQLLFLVVNPVQADDHGVIERTPPRQALLLQRFDFIIEAKGSGGGDLVPVALGFDGDRNLLFVNQRMLVDEDRGQLQLIGRLQCDFCFPTSIFQTLFRGEHLALGVLRHEPGFFQGVKKNAAGTVRHRRFIRVQLNEQVVDPQGIDRGEHVFDRMHAHLVVADGRPPNDA